MPFFLIISMLLIFSGFAVLVLRITSLMAEVKRTVRTSAESVVRLESVVAGIRDEEGRLLDDLKLLSEAAAAWPRAIVFSRESGLLVRNIRSISTAMALLSTLRRAAW
jgi:hypothetical protein